MLTQLFQGPYTLFVLLGITLSLIYWLRQGRSDSRILIIYFGAIGGAFLGAKFAYLLAEGWLHTGPDWWRYWLVGKSITGALLGGFAGVELFKKLLSYQKPTGDRFALIIPLGISMGRLGCLTQGCCQGALLADGSHWPAVPVEIGFNLGIWLVFLLIRNRPFARNQLFHLYLIAYGLFRFGHEFLRATPKTIGPLSAYQLIALSMCLIGLIAFQRRKSGAENLA